MPKLNRKLNRTAARFANAVKCVRLDGKPKPGALDMSHDAADIRDVLFALQGLQTGLIEKDDLLAAIAESAAGNGRPLRETLLARSAVSTDACGVIDSVVAHHVEKHDDLKRSLDQVASGISAEVGNALSSAWPAACELAADTRTNTGEQAGSDGRAGLSQATQCGTVWLSPAEIPGDSLRFAPRDGAAPPRFMIRRPHARGGLGIVHVALDCELNREVAVKQIQERHADESASRARFIFEAEVTGALEHPGVVPVYSLGADANGGPYYAMRFIRGDTFSQAITGYHSR
jgi:hypothetical protein